MNNINAFEFFANYFQHSGDAANAKIGHVNAIIDYMNNNPGLPAFVQYNTEQKTIWNNGPGTIDAVYNTSFGEGALISNITGFANVALGTNALSNITSNRKWIT